MNDIIWVPNEAGLLAAQAAGLGRPLIYAHGLTGCRRQVPVHLATLLPGWRVIAYDQRGHGQSTPVRDPAHLAADAMAGDMASVADAFQVERCVVGGTSMGAATALLFALRCPRRVERLILTAPAFADCPHPARAQLKQIAYDIQALGLSGYVDRLARRDWPAAGITPAAIERRAGWLRMHDQDSLALACEIVADWVILPDLAALARLAVPTTIIAWGGDAIHPLPLAVDLAAAIPGAHLAQIRQQDYYNRPEIIGQICLEWLEGS